MNIKIKGYGLYIPPDIETAKDIAKRIGKTEEWIINKCGVKERRISKIDVDEMGAIAGKEALNGGSEPDLIINASGVPKQTIPDTSTFYQKALNLEGIPSFSIHSTCLSFLVAFNTASALIESKVYKRILIISSDRGTIGRNYKEPESASLLGDGAAAVVLEPSKQDEHGKLLYYTMNTWPSGAHLTEVRGGGTFKHPQNPKTKISDNLFSMDGPGIYKIARKKVYRLVSKTLKHTNLRKEDIDWVVPHQASGKAVDAYISIGKFPKGRVCSTISNLGNCVAASLPITLITYIKKKKVKRGQNILLIGTGAGLSAACALIKY